MEGRFKLARNALINDIKFEINEQIREINNEIDLIKHLGLPEMYTDVYELKGQVTAYNTLLKIIERLSNNDTY